MSAGPFDIGLLIARLQAKAPLLKFVQGAAELATALQQGAAPQTPCGYVLLASEAAPNSYGSSEAHVQTIAVTVNVVLVMRNYRTAELGAGTVKDDLNAVIAQVRGAVLGWAPDSASSGFNLSGGRLENYTNATVWWNEAYQNSYFARVSPNA